jgi:formyltetrahydrofolate-dependent phosphoribosylglycinamide formyltransferase
MAKPINLAVLLSGSGRTLQNFMDRIAAGTLDARIQVVISSRAEAYGLERARKNGIPTAIISSRKHTGFKTTGPALEAELDKWPVDLITLAGFMCLVVIPEKFIGRAMNIHPALIPAFCGKAMYGHFVHEAVIESGCKITGCTVHFADNEYDHGPIILQKPVPVLDDDTPDTLADRVFQQECEAYPEAVQLFAEQRLRVEGRRVRILQKDGRP